MNYRILGNSGLKVSELSLGSHLTFGDKLGVNETTSILRKAYELGINYFDTANVYQNGEAERLIGIAMKEIKRDSIVIGTKAYYPTGNSPTEKGLSRKHLFESVHASLKRMNLDYIDIFYCHSYDKETPVSETVRAIDDLTKQGKIRYAGVSNWTAHQLQEVQSIANQSRVARMIVNQCEYSMLNPTIENEILPISKRLGIGAIVFSPLAQGVLTGKYNKGVPQNSRANNPNINKFFGKLHTTENIEKARDLERIAREYELTLAELAILWVLKEPVVASALIGVTSEEQLLHNVQVLHKELPQEAVVKVNQVIYINKD
ncbi:aldo/keto reductase family protein [Cytobacillus suaedae]|nr:aldo/keto reductase family protein [Cytobacillus suaedae]